MRFVAGRGAVLRCCVQGSVAEMLLAGALWRSCCWPESCGGKPSGINCWPGRSSGAASGSQQAHTKREGPGRDLNISPEPLLFIALRKGNTPCDEAEPPFTSGIHRWHSPPAFTAGAVLAKLPLQLCRDCKEGCSKCKNCVELWEYGKDKGVTEYILSV